MSSSNEHPQQHDPVITESSSKPYGRSDLPQQQHPPTISNDATDMSNLPEEFQYHPAPYHMSHEDLDQVTHHHQIDQVHPPTRPKHHPGSTTTQPSGQTGEEASGQGQASS